MSNLIQSISVGTTPAEALARVVDAQEIAIFLEMSVLLSSNFDASPIRPYLNLVIRHPFATTTKHNSNVNSNVNSNDTAASSSNTITTITTAAPASTSRGISCYGRAAS